MLLARLKGEEYRCGHQESCDDEYFLDRERKRFLARRPSGRWQLFYCSRWRRRSERWDFHIYRNISAGPQEFGVDRLALSREELETQGRGRPFRTLELAAV